jgi:glucose-6-phosphate 1-dehydrogenase
MMRTLDYTSETSVKKVTVKFKDKYATLIPHTVWCGVASIFHSTARHFFFSSEMSSIASETKCRPRLDSDVTHTQKKERKVRAIYRTSTAASNMPHTFGAMTIVVLGASGDLAKKKTYPSLFKLYLSGYLPSRCKVIGFARSDYSDASFRAKYRIVLHGIGGSTGAEKLEDFLQICFYARGKGYDDPEAWAAVNTTALASESGQDVANRVFYFAVPPDVFAAAGAAIKQQCMSKKGWNRMIIEKPFGKDSQSSAELGKRLLKSFTEDELYRIDHYLGKEIVQNIMVLRFGNVLLQPLWNRNYIKSVIISFKENIGTQGRGGYFDGYGIIRDVMQNHLLQILSLVAMEPPVRVSGGNYANYVRDEKVKALRCIPPLSIDDVILGQYVGNGKSADEEGYEPGYLEDPTVPKGSIAPTYCMARFFVNNARWAGVPFIMKAGKALDERKCEIRIQFKSPPGSENMFGSEVPLNELVIRVQPNDAIYFKMNVKT